MKWRVPSQSRSLLGPWMFTAGAAQSRGKQSSHTQARQWGRSEADKGQGIHPVFSNFCKSVSTHEQEPLDIRLKTSGQRWIRRNLNKLEDIALPREIPDPEREGLNWKKRMFHKIKLQRPTQRQDHNLTLQVPVRFGDQLWVWIRKRPSINLDEHLIIIPKRRQTGWTIFAEEQDFLGVPCRLTLFITTFDAPPSFFCGTSVNIFNLNNNMLSMHATESVMERLICE